jgi:cation transport ATPase
MPSPTDVDVDAIGPIFLEEDSQFSPKTEPEAVHSPKRKALKAISVRLASSPDMQTAKEVWFNGMAEERNLKKQQQQQQHQHQQQEEKEEEGKSRNQGQSQSQKSAKSISILLLITMLVISSILVLGRYTIFLLSSSSHSSFPALFPAMLVHSLLYYLSSLCSYLYLLLSLSCFQISALTSFYFYSLPFQFFSPSLSFPYPSHVDTVPSYSLFRALFPSLLVPTCSFSPSLSFFTHSLISLFSFPLSFPLSRHLSFSLSLSIFAPTSAS